MRRISLKSVLLLAVCGTALYLLYRYNFSNINNESLNLDYWVTSTKATKENTIVLSFVVCDGRLNESLNVVKSMLIFTRKPVHLVIFADDERRVQLNETLTRWQKITENQFDFELHKINFPEPDAEYWLNLFRKCSAQRLFFPQLLPHIDSLIYVDTDTIFLGPVQEVWSEFSRFNRSQMTGLAWEDSNRNIAWYPRFAQHPFYGDYGLNSGVMLMNLTRMREFGWMEYITPVMKTWKNHIPWGDQDIINIILSHHGASVRVLGCRLNYRLDQCAHGDSCAGAVKEGVVILHGSRGSFYKDAQPAFRACYEAISQHPLGSDAKYLVSKMDELISRGPPSLCGALKQAFLKVPNDTLSLLYSTTTR